MKTYTISQLAGIAGVSVRTLHYYDQIGLLRPVSRRRNGYRQYNEDSAVRLQQIMFFRELDFSLEEIGLIVNSPDFDVLEALHSHRKLLRERAERIGKLMATVDKTIRKIQGELDMKIKEYYEGFSDEEVEEYRREARERWGERIVETSEQRVTSMGKENFTALQTEGNKIFQAIADNMEQGPESPVVQEELTKWRQWLENFHHYPDEAVLGLGRMYSQDPRFAEFFRKIHPQLPEFLTKAIEYYCAPGK